MGTDGFELRSDGTAVFQFDDNLVIDLRRPTLGEYRLLSEALEQMRQDTIATSSEDNASSVLVALSDLLLTWEAKVFETLGNAPLPSEDQLPAWMLNGAITAQLIEHWQKVPSRRGVR